MNNYTYLIIGLAASALIYLAIVKTQKFHFYAKNTSLMYLMIAISLGLSYLTSFNFFLIYLALFILVEIAYYSFGITIFDENERVESSYDWFNSYVPEYREKSKSSDLTEGYFNNDFSISVEQAMRQKYDKIFELLKLKSGMKVLDVGCGYGQWMTYLKSKGVEAVGLTLSNEQAKHCRGKGFEIIVQDARRQNDQLLGKFDAVSCLGSLEHFAKANMSDQQTNQIYQDLFNLLNKYIDKKSPSKRLMITCINFNDHYKLNLPWYFQAYFIDRHYSGRYPRYDQFLKAMTNFERVHVSDQTEDYRYISIIDPTHFGSFQVKFNTLKKCLYLVHMFLSDPYALHKWLYHNCNSWMWQFGGTSKQVIKDHKNSPFHLIWETFEAK